MLAAGYQHPGIYWFIAPTYGAAKDFAWDQLKAMIPDGAVKRRASGRLWINESDLEIRLRNGATFQLKGADNRNSLRGRGLSGVACDEFADLAPELWGEVIRPALADKQGWALLIGTPRGFDHFYDMYSRGTDPAIDDWFSWQFSTAEGGWVTETELASARQTTDPKTYRQEYEASFEAMGGRVYWPFRRETHVMPLEDDGSGEVLVGLDFNVNPMTSIIGRDNGGVLEIFSELVIPDSNTAELAAEVKSRYGQRAVTAEELARLKTFAHIEGIDPSTITGRPREITVYPDPTGRARRTNADVGVTDYTILRDAGLTVDLAPHPWPVKDRINITNAMLQNANGLARVRVDPSCKVLIKSLEGHVYKDGTSIPDKANGLDHAGEALGYLIAQRWSPLGGGHGSQRVVL